jgi:hypothetical protein
MVVCARTDSPLTRLAAAHNWVRLFAFDLPAGKDGFLATNSLLASAVLLGRAYEASLPAAEPLPPSLAELSAPAAQDTIPERWRAAANRSGSVRHSSSCMDRPSSRLLSISSHGSQKPRSATFR